MSHKKKPKPALPDLVASVTHSGVLFGAAAYVVSSSGAPPTLVPLESAVSTPEIVDSVNSLPLSNRNNPLASLLADLSSPHGAALLMPVSSLVSGEHSLSPLLASFGKTAWQQTVVGLGDEKNNSAVDTVQNDRGNGFVAAAIDGNVVHVSVCAAVGSNIVGSGIELPCKLGVCVNTEHDIALACSPVGGCSPAVNHVIPVEPSPPMAAPSWSSLFTKLPINAGVHTPRSFDNVEIKGIIIPPKEVIDDGVVYWKAF